jgi:biotin carboxyl carrier protein
MTPAVATGHPRRTTPHPLATSVAEGLCLAVAPSTGRFRPAEDARLGRSVEAGHVLGHVTGGRGRADAVRAPTGAMVRGLLVRHGQAVTFGQQLVWLERT